MCKKMFALTNDSQVKKQRKRCIVDNNLLRLSIESDVIRLSVDAQHLACLSPIFRL